MKQFIYILSLIIMVILASCEGLPNDGIDFNNIANSSTPVKLCVRNDQNLIGEEGETPIEDEDYFDEEIEDYLGVVGTFMLRKSDNEALYSNIPYDIYRDSIMDPYDLDKKLYYPADGSEATVCAYFPYKDGISVENPEYIIDDWNIQSTKGQNLDLCIANPVTVKKVDNPEPTELDFNHVFSRIEFRIRGGEGSMIAENDLSGLEITISGLNQPVSYNVFSNALEYLPLEDGRNDNTKFVVSPKGTRAYAIVPPNDPVKYPSSTHELTLKLRGGKTYTKEIPEVNFAKGVRHIWNIEIFANYIIVDGIIDEIIDYGGEF